MKSRLSDNHQDQIYAETVFRTIFTFEGKIKEVFQNYLKELRITDKDLVET